MFVRILTLALFLLLGACSFIQGPATVEQVPALRGTPSDQWQLDGKLGIRYPQHADSASISWQQNHDEYTIQISGPFGQGATLKGMSGYAELALSNRKTPYRSRSPEALMQQVLGWQMPVSMARYWVLGRTDPNYTATPLPKNDAALGFKQLGWTIRVTSTTQVKQGLTLPRKLSVSRGDLRLILVIKRWQFL